MNNIKERIGEEIEAVCIANCYKCFKSETWSLDDGWEFANKLYEKGWRWTGYTICPKCYSKKYPNIKRGF